MMRQSEESEALALCISLRHSACVPAERLSTKDFPEDARTRLGEAVVNARLAAGFNSRGIFAKAIGVGKRSIDALETGEPVVGKTVLKTVGRELGRYLPEWNEDTPRGILTGGPIPETVPRIIATSERIELGTDIENAYVPPSDDDDPQALPDPAQYADLEEYFRATIRHLMAQGLPRDAILRAANDVVERESMRRNSTEGNSPTTSSNGGGTSG